jgi:hypothetical protein
MEGTANDFTERNRKLTVVLLGIMALLAVVSVISILLLN